MTTIDLLGCDGSTWHLLDPTSPVWLSKGIGGLHLFNVTQQWSKPANRSGQSWKGSSASSRSFTMNIAVGDQEQPYRRGEDWRELDGAFWEALSTDESSRLVFDNDRYLSFRLDENNDFDFAKDPAILGKAIYPLSVIADSPEWRGAVQTFPFAFTPDDNSNYYGGEAGLGPPFVISAANLFQKAYVANPGDLETWGTWTLQGPASTVTVGVGSRLITPPFPLQVGDVVIIDTENESIIDSQGNNLWPQMGNGNVDFAPIAPGDLVPIAIGMEDADVGASITLTLQPRYRRAWGRKKAGVDVTGPGSGTDHGLLGHSPLGHGPLGGLA